MRTFLVVWAVAGLLALVACGGRDAGGGGVLGAWELDVPATVSANHDPMRRQVDEGLAQITQAMETLKSMDAEQQALVKAQLDKQVNGLPAEDQALARAVLEGKSVDKLIDDRAAKEFGKRQLTLEFKRDKTFGLQVTGEDAESVEGTWTQEGENLTLTPTKKNGKPPEDESDKERKTLVFKGGKLTMPVGEGAPVIHLKRK